MIRPIPKCHYSQIPQNQITMRRSNKVTAQQKLAGTKISDNQSDLINPIKMPHITITGLPNDVVAEKSRKWVSYLVRTYASNSAILLLLTRKLADFIERAETQVGS